MMPQKRRDTAGEITTRRQTAPILCIMVELVGVEVQFSSSLGPRYEQIFSQRFCSDEFASSIGIRILLAKSLQGEKSGSYLGFWLRWTGPEPFFYPNWRYDASRFSRTGSAPSNSPAVSGRLRGERHSGEAGNASLAVLATVPRNTPPQTSSRRRVSSDGSRPGDGRGSR